MYSSLIHYENILKNRSLRNAFIYMYTISIIINVNISIKVHVGYGLLNT